MADEELCDYTGCIEVATVARKNRVLENLEMHICDRHFKRELTEERHEPSAYWPLTPVTHDEAVIEFLAEQGRRLAHAG